jgi:hypothetical protein
MKHVWKRVTALCLGTLLVVSAVSIGCGEAEEGGKRVIVIGHLTDVTGPAGPALVPLAYGVEDTVRYYNENDLIPGVELKVVNYDTKYDTARDIPGYEWVRERGAQIIITPLSSTAEVLKPFLERDQVVLFACASTRTLVEDPGWIFCKDPPQSAWIKALLKWISEEHWDYEGEGRKPKVGAVGWLEYSHMDIDEGIKEYCDAHPDKFEYVGGYLSPMATATWSGEIAKLMNCDYVYPGSTGIGIVSFVNQFRDLGGKATFISCAPLVAFIGLMLDGCGWDRMDGTLTGAMLSWYEPTVAFGELAKDLLYEYHPDEAADVERSGTGYLGGYDPMHLILDILREAIEEVGVDQFDTQAFYDTAVNFSITYEGLPEVSFAKHQDPRWANDYTQIWEWSAQAEDIVMLADWTPLVTE